MTCLKCVFMFYLSRPVYVRCTRSRKCSRECAWGWANVRVTSHSFWQLARVDRHFPLQTSTAQGPAGESRQRPCCHCWSPRPLGPQQVKVPRGTTWQQSHTVASTRPAADVMAACAGFLSNCSSSCTSYVSEAQVLFELMVCKTVSYDGLRSRSGSGTKALQAHQYCKHF
jgi:hypothetical protein